MQLRELCVARANLLVSLCDGGFGPPMLLETHKEWESRVDNVCSE